ncbi:MoaD/ThiS family protein [Arthrobacter sunyaminii]|uniref:MoaD/ThiS family protein n=1 Tax=Arthrobacter sunyaminii TaxID=2816859 RepID=UPI001A94D6CC|nr:MoaD/ThiS family protein [Arthrobacter sunyaminii]MBO0896622.1 MoaD/ThiS family protein [Arthrobacter sunyaminii]
MQIRYFGAAKAAAGVEEEILAGLEPGVDGVAEGAPLSDLLDFLATRHDSAPGGTPPLKSVISRSTFLVNGFAARDRSLPLAASDIVDILPPFAGG